MPLSPSRWHSTSVAEIELLARDGMHRLRHHLAGAGRLLGDARGLHQHPLQHGRRVLLAREGGSGLRMPAAAERRDRLVDRKRGRAAARDHQHPALHLDAQEQRVPVGRVAHARHQRGRVVDVAACAARPRPRRAAPPRRARCGRRQPLQQLALVALQRAAQVAGELLLVRAEAHAGGQRLDVAVGGRGVGQGAGVLVDAERERGRVHRRDARSPLEQQPQHPRHHAAVGGDKRARRPPRAGRDRRGGRRRPPRRRRAPPARPARPGARGRSPRPRRAAARCRARARTAPRPGSRPRAGCRTRARCGSRRRAGRCARPGRAAAPRACRRTRRSRRSDGRRPASRLRSSRSCDRL